MEDHFKLIKQLILTTTFGTLALSVNSIADNLSAKQQLDTSLALIKDKDEIYNAVIATHPAAKDDAKALDANGTGLLKGMPILIKDNIDLVGMPTTAGSLALLKNYPAEDAPLVAQIKQSGGLVFGKTNLSEWANFRSERSSSGWSAVGGQTKNAIDPTRSPCGSSSGSGVAVALGYVKVAIGTETNGSIVCPATINGVVGFKPTQGIVSGAGIVPLASSQDTAGPIANTIENAALVLSTMVTPGVENHDNLVVGLRDLTTAEELKGKRIGVLASTLGFDPRRDAILNTAIDKLRAAGVTVLDDISFAGYDEFGSESYQLLQYEFRRDLNAYFAGRSNKLSSMTLEKLIEFNKQNASTELKHFDQNIFEGSQAIELSEKEFEAIFRRIKKATRKNGLDKAFTEDKLDAIIGITTGPAWLIDHINGDSFFGPGMSTYPAIAGNPHVTVPGGKIAGLPVGVSFVGERYKDHVLAQLVYRFMQL